MINVAVKGEVIPSPGCFTFKYQFPELTPNLNILEQVVTRPMLIAGKGKQIFLRILDGRAKVTCDNGEKTLIAGDMLLVKAEQEYHLIPLQPFKLLIIELP